jgi:hypothetical protein
MACDDVGKPFLSMLLRTVDTDPQEDISHRLWLTPAAIKYSLKCLATMGHNGDFDNAKFNKEFAIVVEEDSKRGIQVKWINDLQMMINFPPKDKRKKTNLNALMRQAGAKVVDDDDENPFD